MTKRKMKKHFKLEVLERMIVALINNTVHDMRHNGLTDRAIARKLELPRWMIRMVE